MGAIDLLLTYIHSKYCGQVSVIFGRGLFLSLSFFFYKDVDEKKTPGPTQWSTKEEKRF